MLKSIYTARRTGKLMLKKRFLTDFALVYTGQVMAFIVMAYLHSYGLYRYGLHSYGPT